MKLEVDANTAKAIVHAALLLHKMTIRTKTKETSICNVEDAATPMFIYFLELDTATQPPMFIFFLELDMATIRSALQSCNTSLWFHKLPWWVS